MSIPTDQSGGVASSADLETSSGRQQASRRAADRVTPRSPAYRHRRRRQVGSDHRTEPIPVVPPRCSPRALAMGRLALTVTGLSWLTYVITVLGNQVVAPVDPSLRGLAEAFVYVLIVTLLTLSAVAYLVTRQGYLRRTRSTDDFFVEHVLLALAADLSIVVAALQGAMTHESSMSALRLVQLQRRLASIFTAEVGSFERKQYPALSAEPNKAMNLTGTSGSWAAATASSARRRDAC